MNTLFIVGNGFDLAHGLPTRFEDFFIPHLKEKIFSGKDDDGYEYFNVIDGRASGHQNNLDFGSIKRLSSIRELLIHFKKNHHMVRASGLYRKIIDHASINNWVDVERMYFLALRQIALMHFDTLNPDNAQVKVLNDSLEYFTSCFKKYLSEAVMPLITKDLRIDDFVNVFEQGFEKAVLNFNYTNTIELYPTLKQAEVINIHGQVADDNLVIGYGDEHNSDYGKLEDLNVDEYLKFQKSPLYGLDSSYSRLTRFMEKERFKAVVVGHSCGLSDKTLLKYIFNSDWCEKIILYPHEGVHNYLKLYYSLSRHFDNKASLRRKTEIFSDKRLCPQST